jgi:hypothetical protein
MPPYFLMVRFPLVFLDDDCLDCLQGPPPVHEKEGHVFYQTDLQVVAEKLLELFRHGKPDAPAWNPLAPVRELVEKVRRGEQADLFPTPIFDVVNGADLELTWRVRVRQEVQQLQEIAPSSFLDPDGWALLGFPNDRRTILLVGYHKQAQQWEPLVRDELGIGENDTETHNGGAADVRDPDSTGYVRPTQERVWIWAIRPLERDHTPNMCCFIEDAPGGIVQMLHDDRTGASIPASLAPDTGGPIPTTRRLRTLAEMRDNAPPAGGWRVWYRYYRPAERDLSILKAAYPEDDPYNPNWLNVKRDLVCHGHASDVLVHAEAPVLLGLLQRDEFTTAIPRKRKSPTAAKECKEKPVNAKHRCSLSPDDEAKVFEKCRRRCCVCFVLDGDASEKKGQLAHLDQNRSNNAINNFVFLCLPHHDTYDSKTSQAKNLTEREVRLYQAKLYQAVERGEVPSSPGASVLKFPVQQAGPVSISGDNNIVAAGNVNYTVNMPRPKRGKGRSATRPPIIPGTVSEDPRMVGYLNYLVRRYEKFKKWDCDISGQRMGYGVIRNAYKRDIKYELIHTPKESFEAGSQFLQRRIENTRLGRTKRGQKLYDHFDEFDEHSSNAEGLPQ